MKTIFFNYCQNDAPTYLKNFLVLILEGLIPQSLNSSSVCAFCNMKLPHLQLTKIAIDLGTKHHPFCADQHVLQIGTLIYRHFWSCVCYCVLFWSLMTLGKASNQIMKSFLPPWSNCNLETYDPWGPRVAVWRRCGVPSFKAISHLFLILFR